MGREVRKVPANWQHPKDDRGNYIPLHDGSKYNKRVSEWDQGAAKRKEGLRSNWEGDWKPIPEEYRNKTFSDWDGNRPDRKNYMPVWSEEEKTHLQMYENATEGTPISPVFKTAEELARWLTGQNE